MKTLLNKKAALSLALSASMLATAGSAAFADHRDYKTNSILKGGLWGAAIGAGAGVVTDQPVGKSAVLGAGIGAGTQAVRNSRTMRRNDALRYGAYGAMAGAGVSHVTDKSLGKGAILGGALGAGAGLLKNLD